MNHSENSSMRYLLARLKPFGRFTFWAPLGMLSLGLIFYWQYQQHPEWLNQINDQPETLDSYFRPPSIPGQPSITQPNAPVPQSATNDPKKSTDGNWATEWKKELTQEQIIPYSINNAKNADGKSINTPQNTQTSTLFRPLLPPVKPSNQAPTAVKPYQVKSAPISENYLKTAIDRIPTSNPSSYYNTNVAPVYPGQPYNINNPNPSYSGINQPVNPTVTGYQPPTNTGYANPSGGAPGYQNPSYGSSYARPSVPTYAPPQTYQQPTNSSGVPIPNNSATQSGYQIQPRINARPAGY